MKAKKSCKKCGGTGFVRVMVMGETEPDMCDCVREETCYECDHYVGGICQLDGAYVLKHESCANWRRI